MAMLAEAAGAGDDLDHPALRGPVRAARYQCLIDIARENYAIGCSVVMVAPFTAECTSYARWCWLELQLRPAFLVLVWVTVPHQLALERRIARDLPRDRSAGEEPVASRGPVVSYLSASGEGDTRQEADRIVGLADGLAMRE